MCAQPGCRTPLPENHVNSTLGSATVAKARLSKFFQATMERNPRWDPKTIRFASNRTMQETGLFFQVNIHGRDGTMTPSLRRVLLRNEIQAISSPAEIIIVSAAANKIFMAMCRRRKGSSTLVGLVVPPRPLCCLAASRPKSNKYKKVLQYSRESWQVYV